MAKKNNKNNNGMTNMNDTTATNTVKSSAYEASKAKQNYKSKAGATACNITDCHTNNCK